MSTLKEREMWHLLEQIRRQQLVLDKLWEAYIAATHDAWNELEKDRDRLYVESRKAPNGNDSNR